MSTKIPDDAFEQYVALGPGRSYQALAAKLKVDKRSIVRHASKEKWTERLAKVQRQARAESDRKLVTEMQAMRERQLMEARALRGSALKAMKELPLEKALKAAASAFAIAWRQEFLLLGDPKEQKNENVSEILRSFWEDIRVHPEDEEQ